MRKITLDIPNSLDLNSKEIAMLLAARLYEQSKLSLRQAAELAGLSKRTFTELLGHCNASMFIYPSSDLSRDVANA